MGVTHLVQEGGGKDPWEERLPLTCPNLGSGQRGSYRRGGAGLGQLVGDTDLGVRIDVEQVKEGFGGVNKMMKKVVTESAGSMEMKDRRRMEILREVQQLEKLFSEKQEQSKEFQRIKKLKGTLEDSLEVVMREMYEEDENRNTLQEVTVEDKGDNNSIVEDTEDDEDESLSLFLDVDC